MRVVITGATSMIGVSLIKSCIFNKIEVLAIIRKNSKRKKNIPKSKYVKIIERNLCNLDSIRTKTKYDVFFHLGWEGTNKDERDNVEIQNRNIQYSIDAVKLAKKLGCKRFIGVGSQAEYGIKNKKLNTNMKEEPNIAYGIAKLCASKITKKISQDIALEHIWIRVLSVYGPNDNNGTLISYLINKFRKNEDVDLTKCEQMWDYLYCDDAGEALLLIGKKGKNGKIYNLGSGKSKKLKFFVEKIKMLCNSTSNIHYGTLSYSNNQIMYLGTSIKEITNDTGWKPSTTFEKGILSLF